MASTVRINDGIRAVWRRAMPAGLRRRAASWWNAPAVEARRCAHGLRRRAMTTARRREWARDYNARTTDFWLFVVGLHGSGTTLLKSILEQHPAVRSMPREGQYYTDAVPQVVTLGFV